MMPAAAASYEQHEVSCVVIWRGRVVLCKWLSVNPVCGEQNRRGGHT
jgi:hypothetical protein